MAKKAGRPSAYSAKVGEAICKRLAVGETLRSICRDDGMPDKATVFRWIVKPGHPFRDQYVEARRAAGYAHADHIVEISERLLNNEIEAGRAKVAIDALKWSAERMSPKAHSPVFQQQHTSPDKSMSAPMRIELVAPSAPDAEESEE